MIRTTTLAFAATACFAAWTIVCAPQSGLGQRPVVGPPSGIRGARGELGSRISGERTTRQVEVLRLEQSLDRLQSRVRRLERLVVSGGSLPAFTIEESQAELAFAETQLTARERDLQRGEASEVDVAADRLQVVRARSQLLVARAAHVDRKIALEIEVADARRKLIEETQQQQQLQRLVAKGYASTEGWELQQIEVEVDEATRDTGPWLLSIYALPTRGLAEGRLTIEVPEPAPADPEPAISEAPFERPVEPPAPWARPRGAPSGIAQDLHAVFVSTERFRQFVVVNDAGAPDSCRWQLDLLRYLAEQRDRLTDDGTYPTAATREMLQRIVSAIELVEELRTSRDPVLTGPPPRDKALRETWLRMRRDRLEQIESELDEVLGLLRRGHAPELTDEEWPMRLTSCLTACQRHFEQRIRLGEELATNFELTRAQWDRLLAARNALRDLASVSDAPVR